MKIALITEAWHPQVNGVVTTWSHVTRELTDLGHEFVIVHPGLFRTFPFPRYPDIRIAVLPGRRVARLLDEHRPDAIHIATEGPIGSAARRYCLRRGLPFTTSYHTHFPDYLKRYFAVPTRWTTPYFRRFHGAARATLVPTPKVKEELDSRGFTNVVTWSRGVDASHFVPIEKHRSEKNPVFLCAGRVCLEKNLPAFLEADLPGEKVVVGPGPMLGRFRKRYPHVRFTGYLPPAQFSREVAAADVFVFPSLTDTFGLVMLEAMACGVPVAAFPVTGPIDVVKNGITGVLHENLAIAATESLQIDRAACRRHAMGFSWATCAKQLFATLVAVR